MHRKLGRSQNRKITACRPLSQHHRNFIRKSDWCRSDYKLIWIIVTILGFLQWQYILWFNTLRDRQYGRHFAGDILQCIFVNENIWISIDIHYSLFRVELTLFQHWFRYWLGADQATSYYLNQWCWANWRMNASLGFNEFIHDCSNSCALVMELLQFFTESSTTTLEVPDRYIYRTRIGILGVPADALTPHSHRLLTDDVIQNGWWSLVKYPGISSAYWLALEMYELNFRKVISS